MGYLGNQITTVFPTSISVDSATIKDDVTVDTSTLKVDSANNRVGILEASPQAPLHITTGANTNIIRFGADARWGFQRANSDSRYLSLSRAMNGTPSAVLVVDGDNGAITKPLQPAFNVTNSSDQNNLSDNTVLTFDTEIFDQNSDFASNTFTAPVTGKYQLQLSGRFGQLDKDSDWVRVELITSNRLYLGTIIDPGVFGYDPTYWSFNFGVLADMDASDTAYLQWGQQSGSNIADKDSQINFTGYLVC